MLETLPDKVEDYTEYNESDSPTTTNESEVKNESNSTESEEVFEPETGYTFRIDSASSDSRASVSSLDYSKLDNIWSLNIGGATYKVLFPRTDDLVVVDGFLVNVGTSNITGVCLDSTINLSTYFRRTFTVLPLMTSNAQNSANVNGAHSYLSVYSQGTYSNLSVTQVYGDARVEQKSRLGSTWSTVNVIIIGLLALQVLISFIGGLLRRG